MMNFWQTQMLFPTGAVPRAGPLPPGAEELQLQSEGGELLHGVHISPRAEGRSRMLVVGFGGNAWNAQNVAEYLHQLFPEAHVVAFHYRGYRPSGGSPSATALIEDAPRILDLAIDRVRPQRTIVAGFSIGSGVAASLAQSRKVDGLILVTPFDSLKKVAADLFPWLPVGPFFQHELDAGEYLRSAEVPVAILAAERDEIVAPRRTKALRPHVRNLVFERTIAGAGHNDIYGRADFQAAMDEALAAIVAAKK